MTRRLCTALLMPLLLLGLVSGCKSGSKAVGTVTSAAGSVTSVAGSAASSVTSAVAGSSSNAGGASSSGGSSAGSKTCTAGHTQAMINGKSKCLAAGQICSAKAVTQYPQYGFVCTTTNGKLVLRKK